MESGVQFHSPRRVNALQRKVDVHDLKPGMYVTELDRPWRDTPFLFQGFRIESQSDIEEIRKHCQHVYVHATNERARHRDAAAKCERLELERETLHPGRRRREPVYHDIVGVRAELQAARETLMRSRETISSIMEDTRLGRAFDTDGARQSVEAMARSVVRNPDALMCLTQVKRKDEYTLTHSLRVAIIALAFGRHLGLSFPELVVLGLGALLHDIGKVRVPDEILKKPERLNAQEFRIMQRHVPEGMKILEACKGIPPAALMATAHHHERYNGKGYVYGLQGDQISHIGLITGIVDCYDAITSDRSYHNGVSAHQALKKMYQARSYQFHAGLVEQFIQCMGIYPVGSLVEMNTGHVGIVIGINRRRYLRPYINLILDADKNYYPRIESVDLSERLCDEAGRKWEIRSILEPGAHGLDPAPFLPRITTLKL